MSKTHILIGRPSSQVGGKGGGEDLYATIMCAINTVFHPDGTQERLLETKNGTLEKNISCLYLTAKAELARKDAMLMDLRTKRTYNS